VQGGEGEGKEETGRESYRREKKGDKGREGNRGREGKGRGGDPVCIFKFELLTTSSCSVEA